MCGYACSGVHQCAFVMIGRWLLKVVTGVSLMCKEGKAWSVDRHRRDHSL